MKRFLLILSLIVSLKASAQDKDLFFQLPIIPDTLTTLQDRCDYMVTHYWDFCDTKKAFSSRDKMAQAFNVYLSFMPYASAQTVTESVGKFMKRIEKQPADVLFIGELAEGNLYSDTAEFQSDALYLQFAEAVVRNKKVNKDSKLRFQHQINILGKSQIGMIAPAFEYIDRQGDTHAFEPDTACMANILFFNDPDCSDCNMARLRLDADIKTNRLIEEGVVKIFGITPGEPSPEWTEYAARYPQTWTVGVSPQVDETYDLRTSPAFYVLDSKGKIILKHSDINVILNIMSQLRVPKKQRDDAVTAE